MNRRGHFLEWSLVQMLVLSWKPIPKTANRKGESRAQKRFSRFYNFHVDPTIDFGIVRRQSCGWTHLSHSFTLGVRFHGSSPLELAPELSLNSNWLSLNSDWYDFETVKIGDSAFKSFSLKNIGGGKVSGALGLVPGSNVDFSITSGGGTFPPLGHNDEHMITVRFKPSAEGHMYACLKAEAGECSASADIYGTGKKKNSGSSAGFLAGTRIIMADTSYKNIEDIKVGDLVTSYDVNKGKLTCTRVTKAYRQAEDEMTDYYLFINKSLRVTPNHPMYINGKWQEAREAKVGDLLLGVNGSDVVIKSIEKVFERVPTYTFEVAGDKNYFASEVLAAQKSATPEENVSGTGFLKGKPTYRVDGRIPKSFILNENYPDSGNSETTIRFITPRAGPVNLRIYNVAGRMVRELTDGYREAGSYEIRWDGRNDQGHLVPSGIYICRIKAGDFTATRKITLIR